MANLTEFVVRLTKPKRGRGDVFPKGSEVVVHQDSLGLIRIRECSAITLEPEDYEIVIDDRDFQRLLLYVED